MLDNLIPCEACGKSFPAELIDAKPSSRSFKKKQDQRRALQDSGWKGEDFDRLECRGCYGPGFVSLPMIEGPEHRLTGRELGVGR